jgi:hypothetical protein
LFHKSPTVIANLNISGQIVSEQNSLGSALFVVKVFFPERLTAAAFTSIRASAMTAAGTLTFWLNVTSSETTTTTQYDKLFVEVRNTAETLLSTAVTYSNLNKGSAGVYSQKSLNLSAYKGQTVRIQFRSIMDSSVTTTFCVDDASLK